jgi:hypothetical protein
MRSFVVFLSVSFAAAGAFAQQSASTVEMQCHDLASSGNVLAPDETLVNGMACRIAKTNQAAPPSAPPNSAASAAPTSQALPSTPSTPPASAALPAPTTSGPLSARIVSGATVFIAPMDGFENYLAAALQKKNVPLIPVADEGHAMYVLKGTSEEKKAGWAKIVIQGQIHSDDSASVQMFDRQSGAIVFAYAVNKKNTLHGQQTTAEACAKHLKEQMEKK